MARRWISERHAVKILIEPRGAVLALTTKTYSYLFFLTGGFVGWRRVRTADRVVARADYSAPGTLELVSRLYPRGP
jgi:hypothetical protein